MKRYGFTLAEVLITLGIIGVVAALTMPMLSTRAQEQANAAKLSSTVSELENAFGIFLLDKDETDLRNILDPAKPNDSLAPYMKTAGSVSSIKDIYNSETPFKDASGKAYQLTCDGILMTKSGAIVFLEDDPTAADDDANGNVDNYVGDLHIDANGASKPNKLGNDLFSFHLGIDGILYPKDDTTKALVQNGYKVNKSKPVATDENTGADTGADTGENANENPNEEVEQPPKDIVRPIRPILPSLPK